MTSSVHSQWASLLKEVREEIIGLLANRYIFRTIQEIIRRNAHIQEYPGVFKLGHGSYMLLRMAQASCWALPRHLRCEPCPSVGRDETGCR